MAGANCAGPSKDPGDSAMPDADPAPAVDAAEIESLQASAEQPVEADAAGNESLMVPVEASETPGPGAREQDRAEDLPPPVVPPDASSAHNRGTLGQGSLPERGLQEGVGPSASGGAAYDGVFLALLEGLRRARPQTSHSHHISMHGYCKRAQDPANCFVKAAALPSLLVPTPNICLLILA